MKQPELEVNLHRYFDAKIWAAEFKRKFPDSDEELLQTWFANAIMTGYDFAMRKAFKFESDARRFRQELEFYAKPWNKYHVYRDRGGRARKVLGED